MYFFNNCIGRRHASIYEEDDAFYDLDTKGFQSTKARHLSEGEQCVVVSPGPDGRWSFTRFSFMRESIKPDERGELQRVLIGKRINVETLSKVDAAKNPLYSVFFDKNGNFKRQSVLER